MQRGFTLLELSTVLVIISLLAGGIVVGQNLIRQSELRSVAEEYRTYVTAINSFQTKYRAWPGDMRNATSYWGAADPAPATCQTTASTGTEPCDGDGDGTISSGGVQHYERFRFWQHLANAQMIQGVYTGVSGGGGTFPSQQPVIGENCPSSRLGGAGFYVNYYGTQTGNINFFDGRYGNSFTFGTYANNSLLGDQALNPEEAYQIDMKVDNGFPNSGIVVSSPNTRFLTPNCALGANGGTAYNTTFKQFDCNLIFTLEGPI